MSSKLFNELVTSSSSSRLNYQPYIAQFFIILVGVVITSASIIGSGIFISTISEPSSADLTPKLTNVDVKTHAP